MKEDVTIKCDASEKGLGSTQLQKGQAVAFAFVPTLRSLNN